MILAEKERNAFSPAFITIVEQESIVYNKLHKIDLRKKLTKGLALSDLALASARIGIWSLNLLNKKLSICKRCMEILHLQKEHLIGWDLLLALIPEEHQLPLSSAFKAACKETKSIDIHFPLNLISSETNRQKWVRVTGSICLETADNQTIFNGTITDISTIKSQDVNSQDIIAMVSHEIKNPLSAIKLYVQLTKTMAETADDTRIVRLMASADELLDKADNLLEYFLSGPVLTDGKLHLSVKKINVQALLSEVVEHARFTNPTHQFIIRAIPATAIYADKERICQVLQNFLSNAIKYTPKPDIIILSAKIDGKDLRVSVTDHGIGISKNDQEKIFYKFFRAGNALEQAFPGHGVGLYLCKQIIEAHQGRIGFTSRKNKGSTFYFSLPLM